MSPLSSVAETSSLPQRQRPQQSLTSGRERALGWALAAYAVSTLISMAVMGIGAAALFAAMLYAFGGPRGLARSVSAGARNPAGRRYLAASLALTAACAISLAGTKLAPLAWDGRAVPASFWADLAKAWYLFWPLLLAPALAAAGARGRRTALRAWLLAAAAVSVIGIQQHFTGWPRPQVIPGYEPRFHATMFLGHHLSVASILIFPFFAALDLLRAPEGAREAGLPRWVLGFTVLAALVTLFLTFSRMLWVALPVGIALWAMLRLPRRQGVLALAAVGALSGLAVLHPAVSHRLHAALGVGDRQMLWAANWEFFRIRPLTGVGWRHTIDASSLYLAHLYPGQNVFIGHAHDNLLEMLAGTGLPGAAAWLAWCALVLAQAGLAAFGRRALPFGAGLLGAWVVFQLNGLTQVNFWEGKVEHQMAWAAAWVLAWALVESERTA